MPIDPLIQAKRHLVEHIVSPGELHGSVEGRAVLHEFGSGGTTFMPPEVWTQEHQIDSGHGPFTVRVYRADPGRTTGAAFVWNHGGAFLGGDLDMHEADHVARVICGEAGVTVVSVDYHLCNDGVHFPVPHDDVVAAWRWTVAHASDLGIDPARVSLGGASAGGNLAAGAALHLRDDADDPGVDRLVLIYPVLHSHLPERTPELDARLAELPQFMHPQDMPGPNPINLNFLGSDYGPGQAPAHAFPAHGDADGLPPTLVVTCEYDSLRPSGDAYAAQLAAAGVAVVHVVEAGALHGHLNHLAIADARSTVDTMIEFLTR